jgi:hypothetical protein
MAPYTPTPYIFVQPHIPALTSAALQKLARAAQAKGRRTFDKILNEMLTGRRGGAYCLRCGLDLEFIQKCYKAQPYRLICHHNRVSVRSLELQHGGLVPISELAPSF